MLFSLRGTGTMRHLKVVIAVAATMVLIGCAPIALTAGSIAGSAGVNHTMSGIAYKTFTTPMKSLRVATLKTLNRMEMTVTEDGQSDEGWKIAATAADRTIDIDLEKLTPATTRMRVVTNKGDFFFKDGATSTEIILQTAQIVERSTTAKR
jgi:hypothetical protein